MAEAAAAEAVAVVTAVKNVSKWNKEFAKNNTGKTTCNERNVALDNERLEDTPVEGAVNTTTCLDFSVKIKY